MTVEVIPAFGLPTGGMELAIILLIAVLLFGANKIPKLARSTGKAMGEFQRGREEIEQELDEIREGPATGENSESTSPSTTGSDSSGSDSSSSTTSESGSDSDSTKQ
ncbi:MAG: twin-arginine translocase TatA/TatE family subunit [Halodesulfurarchaeum sp.]